MFALILQLSLSAVIPPNATLRADLISITPDMDNNTVTVNVTGLTGSSNVSFQAYYGDDLDYLSGYKAEPDGSLELTYKSSKIWADGGVITVLVGAGGSLGLIKNDFTIAVSPDTYLLTVSAGTGGTVSGTQSGEYPEGEPISVTALANSGYVFAGWTVAGAIITGGNNANPATFSMPEGEAVLTANFARKTVSVGAQSGFMTEGIAGTVNFPVTTANISDGSYTVTVANLPTGVSVQGQVTISNNSGTLTLAGDESTVSALTETLTLTIDGVESDEFLLNIDIPGAIHVTGITVKGASDATVITTDGGTLQMSAEITPVDATNKSVVWSVTNETGSASISHTGLLTAVSNGTVTVRATAVDGSNVFGTREITISGQLEPVYTLTISSGTGGTTVGTTSDDYKEGEVISVTATADSGYIFTGWTITGAIITGGNHANPATFSMPATAVTLTANFAQKTVSVGIQNGDMTAETAGTVTFPVTTSNIANGSYTVTVENLPSGVSVQGQVVINNNSGTLTLAGDGSAASAYINNLRLTIDSVQSAQFVLYIAPAIATTTTPGSLVTTVSSDTTVSSSETTATSDTAVSSSETTVTSDTAVSSSETTSSDSPETTTENQETTTPPEVTTAPTTTTTPETTTPEVKKGVISKQGGDSGKPTIFCALEILKTLIGMPSAAKDNPAALITKDSQVKGQPSIFDVLEILKFLIGMTTVDKWG